MLKSEAKDCECVSQKKKIVNVLNYHNPPNYEPLNIKSIRIFILLALLLATTVYLGINRLVFGFLVLLQNKMNVIEIYSVQIFYFLFFMFSLKFILFP